jgi:gliding motility-associated-like protein
MQQIAAKKYLCLLEMNIKKLTTLFIGLIIFGASSSFAQVCAALGQNPETAFPVCGTSTFSQTSVPICGNRTVPSQCAGTLFSDKNPFWYRFTCFTSGTLGFVIRPTVISDDYDWQLFDITGRNPQEVYSNPALFVACNWSGDGGNTGASVNGTSLVRCEGPGVPLFSSMPNLVAGRTYILLISHFTDSQVGYSLSFGGGTAVITDPLDPHMASATASCDGKVIRVKLNKKMKCNTLASNGSDFTLSSPASAIIAAAGAGCSTSFDMDSLTLTLNNPLPPGNYTLNIGNGADGNTLLDNCNRAVPAGESIPLQILPIAPTPMDSLTKVGCAPSTLELVFRKPLTCSSIAANGSDFLVTGPSAVTITGASATCSNGITTKINIRLAAPIQLGGVYTLTLQTGSDGNTLLDECSQQTPAGSAINFNISDTVNASFTYNILYGCKQNQVQYNHPGGNGINSWAWIFDNLTTSTLQNPLVTYTDFTDKNATLVVSNGTCRDTAKATISFDNLLVAAFEGPEYACPNDPALFIDKSLGTITGYSWTFGNGNSSVLQNPPAQTYPVPATTREETILLTIRNSYGCEDTATQKIKVVNNCFIAVPTAFTPNGDGLNDYLYPLNAYKAKDLNFSVYNRFGQRIFFTSNWTNKWDGNFKGQGADVGTYVWILTYTNIETNKRVEQKGTSILIR